MARYVHHNKCKGGHAVDEVNGKTYCLGRADLGYYDIVYIDECKNCPRLVHNCEGEIEKWIKENKDDYSNMDNSNL